jgi:hypothetical protein
LAIAAPIRLSIGVDPDLLSPVIIMVSGNLIFAISAATPIAISLSSFAFSCGVRPAATRLLFS